MGRNRLIHVSMGDGSNSTLATVGVNYEHPGRRVVISKAQISISHPIIHWGLPLGIGQFSDAISQFESVYFEPENELKL